MGAAGQWAQLCVGPQGDGALGSRQEARSVLGVRSVQIPESKEGSTRQRWPASALPRGHRAHCWQNFHGPQPARPAPSSPALGGSGTLPGQGLNPPYGTCLPPSGYYVEVLLLKLEYTNIFKNKVYIM